MSNCYFCYKEVEDGSTYHKKCSRRFFGVEKIPELQLNHQLLNELAKETVNQRIAVTGIQPKLSVQLNNAGGKSRLTIVGLWGKYILKPQNNLRSEMPEVEDLTMHLASLYNINTCEHCLIPASNGDLVYLAKRFDRTEKLKVHVEDFCQLGEFQTEQKYDSSYERCGKLITKHCTNDGLDMLNYFELLIFSFLCGNNDMHMKNFSLLHQEKEIVLSPAYDLINAFLINPGDKEDMALRLSGKKTKIRRTEFFQLSKALKINEIVFERLMKKFTGGIDEVFDLIDRSFLSEVYKDTYKKIWAERLNRLLT